MVISDGSGYKGKLWMQFPLKGVSSTYYNYVFNMQNGRFARWGLSESDDPFCSPFGPEILDIEITTGYCSGSCPFCYKANTPKEGHNMSYDTFDRVVSLFAPFLTQVALGITDADANKDFVKMLGRCVELGVVPNYTTAGYGMSEELFDATAKLCGAVAVSVYPHNKKLALNTIQEFVSRGMEQVNAHLLYHADNIEFVEECMNVLADVRAAVLLALKPVGRGTDFRPANQEQMNKLINKAKSNKLGFGFDSCSAPKFERWVRDSDMSPRVKKQNLQLSESCESYLFSLYCSAEGIFYPCSFVENKTKGIDIRDIKTVDDVWHSAEAVEWRGRLIDSMDEYGTRHCPMYEL